MQLCLEIVICDPLNFTMDNSKFIASIQKKKIIRGPLVVLGIWGKWIFIFKELESTGDYFQGFEEKTHSFGDLGRPAKKVKKKNLSLKEKLSFRLIFFFKFFGYWAPQDPLLII